MSDANLKKKCNPVNLILPIIAAILLANITRRKTYGRNVLKII